MIVFSCTSEETTLEEPQGCDTQDLDITEVAKNSGGFLYYDSNGDLQIYNNIDNSVWEWQIIDNTLIIGGAENT